MFVKSSAEGKKVILIVSVDDIILTSDHIEEIKTLKDFKVQEFEIKDCEQLRYFLDMEVARPKSGISVSQRKYTLDLLKVTGMLGSKPVDTPIDPTSRTEMEEEGTLAEKGRYQKLVGNLFTYLTLDLTLRSLLVW